MSVKGKFALGAIIGAAAGVVAGVLTAPKSGKETRADLKQRAAELKSDASLSANEAKGRVDEMKEAAAAYKTRGEQTARGTKK